MSQCCNLTGNARVCTAGGAKYYFAVTGYVSGAWLHTDGSHVNVNLAESGHPKLPREFNLSGFWRGPNLVLDDQKSMFVHFLPGGNLTPNPISQAPVPERHATVTMAWGTLSDFESTCTALSHSRRGSGR